jgi:hypothetical protein
MGQTGLLEQAGVKSNSHTAKRTERGKRVLAA